MVKTQAVPVPHTIRSSPARTAAFAVLILSSSCALNTAIAAKDYTARTKKTLETVKSELEEVLDPAKAGQPRPRDGAFWK